MRLPAIAISRWAINPQDDVYRLDGYVGIGTNSPGGLLGLGDSSTYISNDNGELTLTDGVNGTVRLSDFRGATDGYLYTNPNATTLLALITPFGSNPTTIVISSTVTLGSSSLTIPNNIDLLFLRNGSVTIGSGETLTIKGTLRAERFKIFNYTDNTSSIIFGAPTFATADQRGRTTLYPEWFGALGNKTTDDTIAIQRMFNIPVDLNNELEVHFAPGRFYKITDTILLAVNTTNCWIIRGYGSYIYAVGLTAGKGAFKLGDNAGGKKCYYVRWQGLSLQGDATTRANAGTSGIQIDRSDFKTIEDCYITGFYYGVHATGEGGNSCTFKDVSVSGCEYGAHLGPDAINFNVWRWVGGKIQQCTIGIYGNGANIRIDGIDFSLCTQAAINLINASEVYLKFYTEGMGSNTDANDDKVLYLQNVEHFTVENARINGATSLGGSYTKNCGHGIYMENCRDGLIDGCIFIAHQRDDIFLDANCDGGTIVIGERNSINSGGNDLSNPDAQKLVRVSDRSDTGARNKIKTFFLPRQSADTHRVQKIVNFIPSSSDFSHSSWTMANGTTVFGATTGPYGGTAQIIDFPNTPYAGDTTTSTLQLTTAPDLGLTLNNKVVVLRYWYKPIAVSNASIYDQHRLMSYLQRTVSDSNYFGASGVFDGYDDWYFAEHKYSVPETSPNAQTMLKVGFESSVYAGDAVRVAIWGVQLLVLENERQYIAYISKEAGTSAVNLDGYGYLVEGPLVLTYGANANKQIIAEDSPQVINLAPPAGATAWRVGDFVWNSIPQSNGVVGWTCVITGNPGTWEALELVHNSTLDGYTSGAVTKEALTFTIDYNDATAVDVPSTVTFYRQSDITNFLAANGTSSFKYVQSTYNALPGTIKNVITFNMAAGFHSPRSTDTSTAWTLNTKKLDSGGEFVFQGSSSYNAYSPSLTNLTVSSSQIGSSDPFITFSGTPFTGLSLDGYYAVISTGQVTPIHDNDSSTIRLLANLSPTPTNGVSTVTIARPSTIMINSIDGVNRLAGTMMDFRTLNNIDMFPSNRVTFNDITFIPFRASNAFLFRHGRFSQTRCAVDRESVSSENGNTWNVVDSILPFLTACVFVNPINSGGADGLIACTRSPLALSQCYLKGSEDAIDFFECSGKNVSLQSCVLSGVGSLSGIGSITVRDNVQIDMFTFSGAKVTEFRNGLTGVPSIRLLNGGKIRDDVRPEAIFKNNLSAAIRLDVSGIADCSASSTVSGNAGGIDDGGGNQDVGFDVVGPSAYLKVDTNSNVTGEAGNVRIGGIVITYTSISEDRPVVDLAGNYLDRI